MNFSDYEKMVAKLAWKYTRDMNTVEDLISISKVEFYLSITDFNPTRATSFKTYFYTRARNAMINYMLDYSRHTQHNDIDDTEISAGEIDGFAFMDSLKTLSKESQEVIQVILNSPDEVLQNAKFLSPKHLRGAVASVLTKMGWHKPYIYRSFKEIRAFINQVG